MFTDGLFEVRGSGDEILGLDGLLALAADYRPGRGLLEDLLTAVRRHSRHGEFEDDLCVVALEMLQQGPVSNRPLTA
jgi:serine phosphatase RsbU (regulator of sigma subunit)